MGKVLARAKIQNLEDLYKAHQGLLAADQVRTLDVSDALVDTGAIGLMIPTRLLPALGLRPTRLLQGRSVSGTFGMQMYEAVRLTIQGRECSLEVSATDSDAVRIGRIPLLALDWVEDTANGQLIGDPAHGGQHVAEVL
jgi:predicted aspartyl protease